MGRQEAQKDKYRSVLHGVLETHIAAPIFGILLIGAIWLGAIYSTRNMQESLEHEVAQSTLALSEVYEAQLIRNFGFIDQTLKTVKYAYERSPDSSVLSDLNSNGLLPPKLVFAISIVDKSGNVIAHNAERKLENIPKRAWFSECEFNVDGMHINFRPSEKKGGDKVYFCRRLVSKKRGFLGSVMLSASPDYFASGYDVERLGEEGLLGLVEREGRFIARRSGNTVSIGNKATSLEKMKAVEDRDHVYLLTDADDSIERYVHVRKLYGYPLTIMLGLSKREHMAAFYEKQKQYYLAATIASALLLFVTLLLTRLSWALEQSRKRIRKKQQTYYAASEASMDAMFVFRCEIGVGGVVTDFILENVNQRGAQMYGVSKADFKNMHLMQMPPQFSTTGTFQEFVNVYQTGELSETESLSDVPPLKGKWLYRQVIRVEDGIVVIVRDITERKIEEARMKYLAMHDALTGLPNRTLLDERIKEAITHAKSNQQYVAILFMDLNRFKEVNDTYGHAVGDELLIVLSKRMQNCLRQTDTVARLGGDEFVIVLAELENSAGMLMSTLERIRGVVSDPVHFGEVTLNVTPSIGIAVYPENGSDSDTLFAHADAAMYEAKARGENNYLLSSDKKNVG